MSWDPAGIKKSTDEIVAQIPGIEGFVEGVRRSLTDSVEQVVTQAIAAVADGISQIVRLGASVDGATIDWEVEEIIIPPLVFPTIPKIKSKFTIHMPLWKDK